MKGSTRQKDFFLMVANKARTTATLKLCHYIFLFDIGILKQEKKSFEIVESEPQIMGTKDLLINILEIFAGDYCREDMFFVELSMFMRHIENYRSLSIISQIDKTSRDKYWEC